MIAETLLHQPFWGSDHDRYRVTVIGSVPIKNQMTETQEIETRKLEFCLRGEIDKTTLYKTKPRKKFAEDGRMDGSHKAPTISPIPVCSVPPLSYPLPQQ